jgi:ubiquinone biosynthesis protein
LAAVGPDPYGRSILLDVGRMLLLSRTAAGVALPLVFSWIAGQKPTAQVVGARLRVALQRMGLTYVKLGQFMAMRFDILPEAVCNELAQLFDDVEPAPKAALQRVLTEEFGVPAERVFASFDWQPMAAASVAQVHRATLADGQAVAVKVQRPGVARIFGADMRNLMRLARLVDSLDLLGPQSVSDAVVEFERFTTRELDFVMEGKTAERLRRNASAYEYAPKIFWKHTTSRVLTMELITGHRLSDVIAGEAASEPPTLDLDRAARHLARACLRQLFVTGFFHADPHPGNVFILDNGSICFVDFGIFGQLSPGRRETFAAYIEEVAMGNIGGAYRHFMRLLVPTPDTDHRRLRRDIEAIFARWRAASVDPDTPLSERHLGKYVGEFIGAARNSKVRMSLDTLLFWRTLIVLDATALRFRHSFDLLEVMRQFFMEIRPGLAERLLTTLEDRQAALAAGALCLDAPRRASEILSAGTRPIQLLAKNGEPAGTGVKAIALAAAGLGVPVLALRLEASGWAVGGAACLLIALAVLLLISRRTDA